MALHFLYSLVTKKKREREKRNADDELASMITAAKIYVFHKYDYKRD